MANLLEQYEAAQTEMYKEAEMEALYTERIDAIVKYASLADELLSEQYNEDQYNEEDVVKLAAFLIESDIEAEEDNEKIAEYDQLGRIMARAYADELVNLEVE